MSGSTSVAPLAALLARKYLNVCDHCVNFKLLQGGSDIGVSDVAAGRVTIGNSSRDPKPTDPGGLVFNKIAHDAICIVTNNANPLPGIDQAGVQAIFGGSVRSWSQVSRARRQTGTIDLVRPHRRLRYPGRLPEDLHGHRRRSSAAPARRRPTASSSSRSRATRTAIGYVSLFFTNGVHTVPYKGVACTLRNAKSGQYGGVRNFYMVTRGAADGRGQEVDQLDHAQQSGQQDRRHRVGAAAARCSTDGSPDARSQGTAPTSAPSSLLGALASAVLLLIAFMIVFVFAKAWPSFAHNGLAWFGAGGNVDDQLTDIFNSPANPSDYVYTLHAWPLLYATALITGVAVLLGDRDLAALGDVHRRVRARRRCSACCSRWSACSPRCRR